MRDGVRSGEERRAGREGEGSMRSKAVMSCAIGDAVGLACVDLVDLEDLENRVDLEDLEDLADLVDLEGVEDDCMGGRGEGGAG